MQPHIESLMQLADLAYRYIFKKKLFKISPKSSRVTVSKAYEKAIIQ
jgi:hypothetical protein